MTTTNNAGRNEYTASGSNDTFVYGFKILDQSQIAVYMNGALQTVDVDYTVTAVGVPAGGNVVFTTDPPASASVVLIYNVSFDQLSDYLANEAYPSVRVENDYDKLAMIVTQLKEILARIPKLNPWSLFNDLVLDDPVADSFLQVKTDLSGIQNATVPAGTATPVGGTPVDVTKAAAVEGASATASRTDHKHSITTAAPTNQDYSDVAAEGSAASLARSDHLHGMPSAPAVEGTFGSVNLVANNNSGTPNTQFDIDADVAILRNVSNESVVRYNPGAAITNNVSTTGPAANGRDQAGAFSASSWVHFYWIWNGTTLATVSSAVAPPTGPTLPSTYTHWSYVGAVRFNGSSQLVMTYIRGNRAYYEAYQNAVSASTATIETTVDLSTFVPPNALSAALLWMAHNGNNETLGTVTYLRVITAVNFARMLRRTNSGGQNFSQAEVAVPNIGQQVFFLYATGTPQTTIDVLGYILPNGAS